MKTLGVSEPRCWGWRGDISHAGATISVLSLGPTKTPLDLIFMDPPYDTGAGQVALDKLARLGWTSPATWISIETDRREDVAVKGFTVDAVRDVGKARLTLLRAEDNAPAA